MICSQSYLGVAYLAAKSAVLRQLPSFLSPRTTLPLSITSCNP